MKKPWEHDPRFTRERLIAVSKLILGGRHDALDRFDPVVGCNGWTLGCEAFAFGCARILEAAGSPGFEWLNIIDPTMHLIFSIDGAPARFYRGAPDEPTTRTLRVSFSELRQGFLDLGAPADAPELLYRFAVETDDVGEVSSISFVGLSGEMAEFVWEIPLDKHDATVAQISRPEEKGVDLPAPQVRPPSRDDGAAANDDRAV